MRSIMDLSVFWVLLVKAAFLSDSPSVDAASISFDFENHLENSDIEAIIPRSNASAKQTVLLKAGHYAEIPFCLPVEATVTVEDVRYSNDGGADSIPVFIDEELVGSFETREHTNWGFNWNHFISSNTVGDPKVLPPGFHKVQFSLNQTDINGVELDTVRLNIEIPDFSDTEYLRCQKCLEKVVDDVLDYDEEEQTGAVLLLQNQGLIASDDGETVAAIDMFPRPLVPCRVVSVTPWYVGNQPPNAAGAQTVWQIGNEDQSAAEFSDVPLAVANTPSFVIGEGDSRFWGTFDSSAVSQFLIRFSGRDYSNLLNIPNGQVFVEVGLANVLSPINMSVQLVSTTAVLSPPAFKTFEADSLTNIWQLGAGQTALDPLGPTTLQIDLISELPTTVEIDYVRLFVNDVSSESAAAVDAQEFAIEAVSQRPRDPSKPTMAVRGINPTPVNGADAIVIKVRPNGGLDTVPIFELSQDGSISLTSPIMGDFLPADRRSTFKLAPGVAGIRSVNVNPSDLSLNVTFLDDSTLRLLVDATSETAEFTITNANVNIDTETSPLVRFIAPWTSDASNGVDTVVTNGRTVNQLTNGWETQEASTVDFINRCGSTDEATGSDWKIELLE